MAANTKDENGALQTRDLKAVELMSEGGPYFGKGSPPEGDFFSREDLEEIASANRELYAEVRPPNKLGHSKEQILLAQSGLAPVDAGEFPAAGWLQGDTFAVVDGEDGKAKLIADAKRVPRKLGDLFEAGAWSRKSVELSKVKSQTLPGKTFAKVVTGLAWLGAKAPAIRTLDEVLAWYAEGDEPVELAAALLSTDDVPAEVERTVDLAEGDVVWNPSDGYGAQMRAVEEALNPSASDNPDTRYWVQDIAPGKALVARGQTTWVVNWKQDDGRVAVAPATEWAVADQAWVEASKSEFQDRTREIACHADTKLVPENQNTELSVEQIVSLAATFGIEEADEAKRKDAVLAKFSEFAPVVEKDETVPNPTPTPNPTPEPILPNPHTPSVSLSHEEIAELRANSELGKAAYEARRVEKRDDKLTAAVEAGRLDPSKMGEWRGFYDANEEMALQMLAALPVNNDLLATFGSDDDGEDDGAAGTAYADDFQARHGMKAVV